MAARDVYDTQPPVTQADRTIDENALIVRATMDDHVAHAFEDSSVYSPP
jgi:hypothetical protein